MIFMVPMMTEPVPNVGRSVRALREERGLSQMALAVAAGLSLNAVARLEQGGIPDPRLSTVVAIARALGVTLDQLVKVPPGTELPAEESKPKRRTR
jgi:transcriptional regulator with XRE-family HTH domain